MRIAQCTTVLLGVTVALVSGAPPRGAGRRPRPCPAEPVRLAGRDVAGVLAELGARLVAGATDDQLADYVRIFGVCDRDKDGRHSRTEYVDGGRYLTPQARAGIFGAADNNADGFVTRTEYVLNRIITDEAKRIVQATDGNRDGRIVKAEFVAGCRLADKRVAAAVFDGLDVSGDGVIAVPEYLRVWGDWARRDYRAMEKEVQGRLGRLGLGLGEAARGRGTTQNGKPGRRPGDPSTPAAGGEGEPPPDRQAATRPATRHATRPAGRLAVGQFVTLTVADVADGDGPDGKGNSADDTWGFWFELAHARGRFARLDLHTTRFSPARRKSGIPRKVRGPIAGMLPNPDHTQGWIYHSDWDGRFEGVRGDRKAGLVMLQPYVEKNSHCAVAVTWRVGAVGLYRITGTLTDLQVAPHKKHTGIVWALQAIQPAEGKRKARVRRLIGKGGPVGDKVGPDSQSFAFHHILLRKGELLRLIVHPNGWWGSDLTALEKFTITRSR